jgi:hypothetical protein
MWALDVVFSTVYIDLLFAKASASSVQVPEVLRLHALVPGPFGVMFMMCLDLFGASQSSLQVSDEHIPKVPL